MAGAAEQNVRLIHNMRTFTLITAFLISFQPITAVGGEANIFLEAGIPAVSREWRGPDYTLTLNILSSGKIPLPRLRDKQGTALIERITSRENFSFYRNKNLPIKSRFGDYGQLQSSANSILGLYSRAAINKGENLHEELTYLLAFMLHTTALGIELINEYVPTIPKDAKYETRMNGLKDIYSGATTQFVAAETSLSELSYFSRSDLSLILGAMTDTLPRIKQAFPQDYHTELRIRLIKHKAHFKKELDLKNIESMLQELRV